MGLFNLFRKNEVIDLRSTTEREMIAMAENPLADKTLEKYAINIAEIYLEKGLTLDEQDAKARKIGEAINDFNAMVLVTHRAIKINNRSGGDLCGRNLEYAWDGIAGWMK
jgi:hypothetical protein